MTVTVALIVIVVVLIVVVVAICSIGFYVLLFDLFQADFLGRFVFVVAVVVVDRRNVRVFAQTKDCVVAVKTDSQIAVTDRHHDGSTL